MPTLAEIEEALDQGDTGIVTALVVVAANRSGKKLTEDMVLDWTLSDLEFLPDEEDDKPAKKKKAEPDPS